MMTGIHWALYRQYVTASYLIMSGNRIPLWALGPTQPPKSLSRGKSGQGVTLTTYLHISPRLLKE
jgi:hypothetical protein